LPEEVGILVDKEGLAEAKRPCFPDHFGVEASARVMVA